MMWGTIQESISRESAYTRVGAGWKSLIDEVYDAFEKLGRPMKIIAVKEKFGGLRIYTDDYDQAFDALLQDVGTRSFYMCEECGKAGQLRSGGWYKTLCDEHANGREPIKPF